MSTLIPPSPPESEDRHEAKALEALLRERHHTILHTRRLAGRVVKGASGERVEWDLTRGSYDDLLARRAACDTETEPA